MWEREYRRLLTELIQAIKNEDLYWFTRPQNRVNMKRLYQVLIGNPNTLQQLAAKKLKELIRVTKNRDTYQSYLRKQKHKEYSETHNYYASPEDLQTFLYF